VSTPETATSVFWQAIRPLRKRLSSFFYKGKRGPRCLNGDHPVMVVYHTLFQELWNRLPSSLFYIFVVRFWDLSPLHRLSYQKQTKLFNKNPLMQFPLVLCPNSLRCFLKQWSFIFLFDLTTKLLCDRSWLADFLSNHCTGTHGFILPQQETTIVIKEYK